MVAQMANVAISSRGFMLSRVTIRTALESSCSQGIAGHFEHGLYYDPGLCAGLYTMLSGIVTDRDLIKSHPCASGCIYQFGKVECASGSRPHG